VFFTNPYFKNNYSIYKIHDDDNDDDDDDDNFINDIVIIIEIHIFVTRRVSMTSNGRCVSGIRD